VVPDKISALGGPAYRCLWVDCSPAEILDYHDLVKHLRERHNGYNGGGGNGYNGGGGAVGSRGSASAAGGHGQAQSSNGIDKSMDWGRARAAPCPAPNANPSSLSPRPVSHGSVGGSGGEGRITDPWAGFRRDHADSKVSGGERSEWSEWSEDVDVDRGLDKDRYDRWRRVERVRRREKGTFPEGLSERDKDKDKDRDRDRERRSRSSSSHHGERSNAGRSRESERERERARDKDSERERGRDRLHIGDSVVGRWAV